MEAARANALLPATPLSLREQLSELESILSAHAQKLTAIRDGIIYAPVEALGRSRMSAISSTSRPSALRTMDDASAIELSCLDAHSHNLDKFLDVHIKNIQALYSSLNSHNDFSNGLVEVVVGVPQGNASDLSQSPPSVDSTEKEIKALSQQFSIIVVFSTFTAGLTIAYLQLMRDLLSPPDMEKDRTEAVHWYMGFGFGLTGLVWNLAIAVVAGADTAACASGRPWKNMDGIRGRFVAFVFAQFLGAGIFMGSIGLLLYPFHSGHILAMLPIVIFPAAVIIAGMDLASTSGEFRNLKSDFAQAVSRPFRGLFCSRR